MFAGSSSGSGVHKRSLAELLATRPKKADRKAESGNKSLQEAVLYLLSCRQDVNQFLLEVEALPCKKVRRDDGSASAPIQEATAFTDIFIASALRDQALLLNLPPNILGAKAAASNIQKICQNVGNGAEETLLSREQRDRLTDFLQTLKGLQAENCFSRSVFLKQIWEQERPPAVEVVWHLQNSDIVGLEDVLESCRDPCSAVDWFCRELHSLFLHMEKSLDVEFCEQMISGFLVGLIGKAFCKSSASGKKSECSQSTKISLSILDKMLSWFLDRIPEAYSDESYKPGVEQFWLIAYDASRYRVRVIPEFLEDFFTHTLSQTLVFRPKLKVSDAIRLQGGWSFAKTWPLLTTLYRKLFVLLNAEKLLSRIQRVLDTQEVNWHHVLACISCLVVCQPEAQALVKDLLSRLLSQAFETYELEYLITAFLVARQAALEGPAAFMSYTEWFRGTFGSPSSHQSITKKSLLFLLKFLSDLVPYETSQYLKVHILHPPFVAAKLRPLLMEYITLAKTRLADMKVSIEDMGLYEDLSVASDKHQTQPQAQQDVEKAVQIFQNTGKIPASVMEASIFRRPYFTSRFLPALLTPRPLPEAADSLMLLIDALRRSDKIPPAVMSSYLDACELEKHRKLEGNEKMEVSLNEEPMARLQAPLWELRSLIADQKPHDEISCQVAVVADRLASALGSANMDDGPVMSQPLFTESVEDLEPQELKVADLLLTCFCQCVMAASSANPPDRQGPWPSLYVKMLCGHPRALSAVLSRILQLLCQQAGLLTDPHVVGLAVFSVHLHECRESFTSPNIEVNALEKFWELVLKPRCMKSASVILRFCTAAVSYTCCRFSLLSPGVSLDCIPPLFMRKLQHLLPRLVLEAREEWLMEEDEEKTHTLYRSMLFPSAGWKEATVRLWHQIHFQKLLTEQTFQLSFRDWLQWEMELGSDKDPLCDTDRHEYQRWALNCCFLPESSTKGGCGNDLEVACSIMVEALLEFGCRSESSVAHQPPHTCTGMADILCRLQELVCDLLTQSHSGNLRQTNFLFNIFHRRLEVSSGSRTSAQLRRHGDLATCTRILLGLPPAFLIGTSSERGNARLDCEDLFRFINKELKSIGQRGCALPYDFTAHFFRGLLGASAKCEDPSDAVNCILRAAHAQCPIILTSAAHWWPRLGPAIESQWSRLHGGVLPKQIAVLREIQSDVDRCLAHHTSLPLTDTAWLSAAILHFTMRRKKMEHEEILQLFGRKHVQTLDSLLFFSVLDLIPVLLEEGERPKKAQENCLFIIRCVEANGGSWVTAFQPTKEKHVSLLQQTAPEALRDLLPLAFFSLAPRLPVERTVLLQDFVCVTLELYARFLQLFVDGNPVLDQADTNEVFSRGRHFLLNCVQKCPSPSSVVRSRLPQVADSWEEKDPELAALLRNILQPCQDEDMFDQPDLF
ncbi:Fanconi anemia group A protein isoform X1 [Ranitomeya imitator]|uniref:Fanconi anemia group A protein isoform X1 n=1 Tax=Ranitomeya imitator TaxID=111125 RepID=UPI0037E9AE66